jgi:aspartate/glutamate racemase
VRPVSEPIADLRRTFEEYIRVTGLPHLGPEPAGDPGLLGRRLGLLNGSSWVSLWSNFFARRHLPGVQLVNAGNDAVQLNFMAAHARGERCPPKANIEAFVRYARDLADLGGVDAILITCSTMNRAYVSVQEAMVDRGIQVLQIDAPMMERAVEQGGPVLVLATHGPTVRSTSDLLDETAHAHGKTIERVELSLPAAWEYLARGEVDGHNEVLANAIREQCRSRAVRCVVLAQLSMAVFSLSYADPAKEFGVPVWTSAECGFQRVREILLNQVNRRGHPDATTSVDKDR